MGSVVRRAVPGKLPGKRSSRRDQSGAATVEAALILCFLVIPIVFGILSYGYMLTFRQSLSQAATEAARAAAVKTVSGSTVERQAAQTTAAKGAVKEAVGTFQSGMECGQANLTCDVTFVPCPDVSTAGCVQVKVSYPYRDHSLLPSVPGLGFTLPESVGYTAVAGVS